MGDYNNKYIKLFFYFMHPNFTLAILVEEILIKYMCSVVKNI